MLYSVAYMFPFSKVLLVFGNLFGDILGLTGSFLLPFHPKVMTPSPKSAASAKITPPKKEPVFFYVLDEQIK